MKIVKKLLLIIPLLIAGAIAMHLQPEKKKLIIKLSYELENLDSLYAESLPLVTLANNLYSPLFSTNDRNSMQSTVLASWTSAQNGQEWILNFKDGITYSNGQLFSPKDYVMSLMRTYLLKKKNSSNESSFLHHIKGIQSIKKISDIPSGVSWKDNELTLSFEAPVSNLISQLTSVIYGIVPPSNYSSDDGHWYYNNNQVVTSGDYLVEEMSKEKITLKARKPMTYEKVSFICDQELKDFDFHFGPSYLAAQEKDFHSNPILSLITFFRVMSWLNPTSPLADIRLRKIIKEAVWQKIIKNDLLNKNWQESFVKDIQFERAMNQESIPIKVSRPLKIYIENENDSPFKKELKILLTATLSELNIPYEFIKMSRANFLLEFQNRGRSTQIDIAFSQLHLERDMIDLSLNFAFGSTLGLNLPDLGKIKDEILAKGPINYAHLNQEIDEQALIWMIGHYKSGMYTSKRVNVDNMTLTSPSVDLNLIQRK